MTPQERKVMELALEALENLPALNWIPEKDMQVQETITAIKEALAQTEQEAVAWLWELTGEVTTDPDRADGMWKPLFTTPPQRKPLTNEEIMNIAKVSCIGISPHEDTLNFAKVIEAVHGIKE